MDIDHALYLTEKKYRETNDNTTKFYFETVGHMLEKEKERQESASRPLPNAAAEVQALAAEARQALASLQSGWLWRLLTRPALRVPNVSNDQPTSSDAS